MLVPLFGFLRGDTIGLVVLVHDHQTVADIADTLQQAACMRVAPRENARVYFNGVELDPSSTVAGAGLSPLDRVDVVQEEA
ncbi:MAG TPA: toluene-4-monooxygenase system B family protein [Kofleriaceae bacterium]|nr:toluene-4-monooxygenase system B family protein [Kofleriaceae bacterium]